MFVLSVIVMLNAWKIGVSAGSILLGVYFLFNQQDIYSRIIGIGLIAFGLGLFASAVK